MTFSLKIASEKEIQEAEENSKKGDLMFINSYCPSAPVLQVLGHH